MLKGFGKSFFLDRNTMSFSYLDGVKRCSTQFI